MTCSSISATIRNSSALRWSKAQGWLSLRLRDLLLPLFVPLGQKAQERLFAYRADQEPLSLP